MKKILFTFVALAGLFVFASCSEDRDSSTKKTVDQVYAQAETDINAVNDFEGFYACIEQLNVKKEDLEKKIIELYSTDGKNIDISDEMKNYIYERATAYNKVEGAKYAELFTPYLERLEKAMDAIESGKTDANMQEFQEALDALMEHASYDNVPLDLQERCQEDIDKMDALGLE